MVPFNFKGAQFQFLGPLCGSFRPLGVPYFGVRIIRILLFRVLYQGPLFPEILCSPSLQGKLTRLALAQLSLRLMHRGSRVEDLETKTRKKLPTNPNPKI